MGSKRFSQYEAKCHSIITPGESAKDGMEKYDINKDEWMLFMEKLPIEDVIEMFIDETNANIVYMMGYTDDCELEDITLI